MFSCPCSQRGKNGGRYVLDRRDASQNLIRFEAPGDSGDGVQGASLAGEIFNVPMVAGEKRQLLLRIRAIQQRAKEVLQLLEDLHSARHVLLMAGNIGKEVLIEREVMLRC